MGWYRHLYIVLSESLAIFKGRLLSFISTIQSKVYNIFDPIGMKLLTHLHLSCSHLNGHHCYHFSHFDRFYRFDLINSVKSVSDDFESFSDDVKSNYNMYKKYWKVLWIAFWVRFLIFTENQLIISLLLPFFY